MIEVLNFIFQDFWLGVEVGYESGAKARDEQWQVVVSELRGALKKMTDHGLGHYEDCDYMEYEEDESICNCKVGKVNADCIKSLTKADQLLKEMGIKL